MDNQPTQPDPMTTAPNATAPNTRRPWHRRSSTRAAAAIMTGGALMAADTLWGMTHDSAPDKLAAALAMLTAAALVARGCLEVRPCYRRPTPEEEADRMND